MLVPLGLHGDGTPVGPFLRRTTQRGQLQGRTVQGISDFSTMDSDSDSSTVDADVRHAAILTSDDPLLWLQPDGVIWMQDADNPMVSLPRPWCRICELPIFPCEQYIPNHLTSLMVHWTCSHGIYPPSSRFASSAPIWREVL